MSRSKRDAHLKQEQRFSRHSDLFQEEVIQQFGNRFGIERTNVGYPCLTYDLHAQEQCRTREEIWEIFEKTLATVKGIARLMKKHDVFKILLIPGKGRFVLKKQIRLMFEDSTDFCLRPIKDNEGMIVLKQIKK